MIERLKYEELSEFIQKNNINFVASAVTPWHASGVDVSIKSLEDKGIIVNGLVLIEIASLDSIPIINNTHFQNKCCKYYYLEYPLFATLYIVKNICANIYSALSVEKKACLDNAIYICSPWSININVYSAICRKIKNKKFHFILYEEGLATYFQCNKFSYSKFSKNHNRPNNILKELLSYGVKAINNWIYTIFTKGLYYSNYNLFYEGDQLCPNSVAIEYYKKILHSKCTDLHNETYNIEPLRESVIICTQAYKRDKIYKNTDISTLKQLIDSLNAKGFKVILKPHPYEKDAATYYSHLNCEIFTNNNISFEYIVTYLKGDIKALISFSSTVLVTAKLFYNINAIALTNIVEIENYGQYIQEELMSFRDTFSWLVPSPSSIKELINIIK